MIFLANINGNAISFGYCDGKEVYLFRAGDFGRLMAAVYYATKCKPYRNEVMAMLASLHAAYLEGSIA